MKKYFFIFLFFSFPIFADIPWQKLRSGDVILLSLECWVCQLIEQEEGLPYSHMALVYRDQNGIRLIESWGREGVAAKSPEIFFKDKRVNSKHKTTVLRHQTLWNSKKINTEFIAILKDFLGKKYDPYFLWDNHDENNIPMYYCSEFIFHFFEKLLKNNLKLKTKKMTFNQNSHYWEQYFRALKLKIPAGKEGISPADFAKSTDFKIVY